ncbi:hypothetical protein [Streptomyces sp. NPDC057939]|uniref:tetratricopeptide repeat protein n=1 Tax=Streptomyces sp. NPDC057939 TaxID=3346284 RepID=UPI0036E46E98
MATERLPDPVGETLRDAVRRAAAGPVVVRLRAPIGTGALRAVERLRGWADRHGHPLLVPRVATGAPTAFGPVRDLLRSLLSRAERENGGPLTAWAGELAFLLPELREGRPEYVAAPPLTRIALGGTKRRLHRDSERLFRLVSAAAGVLGLGFAGLRRERTGAPLVLVENAELVDRYTLACLLHLCRVSRGPGPVLVMVTGVDDGARPRWAVPALTGPPLAEWTDAEAELGRVLDRFFAGVGAIEVRSVEVRTVEGEAAGVEALEGVEGIDIGAVVAGAGADEWRGLVRAVLLGDPELAATLGGPLPAHLAALSLAPAVRRAVHDRLGAEEHRRACAELVAGLGTSAPGTPPGRDDEGHELLRARLEAGAGDTGAATRRALRLVQRSYGLTLNYELMLLCARIALAPGAPRGGRLPALLFTGLTHAYLDNHEVAGSVFDAAHAEGETPEVLAQICYYQGLLAAKRRDRMPLGTQWFSRGLGHLDGLSSAPALLESGWLRNGMAMVAWREGRYGHAEHLVRSAITDVSPLGDAQSVNLRINLVNNLSVLLEARGEYAAALDTWRSLAGWSNSLTGGSFTKSYLYRESWLLLRTGDVEGALRRATASLAVARRFRDTFHMDIIARACAYLACRSGDHPAAIGWERTVLELMHGLGHTRGEARAYGQLAHLHYQSGDAEAAVEALDRAAALSAGPARDLLTTARRGIAEGRGPAELGPHDELLGIALDRPKAKLTTPFSLAHLATDDSFATATHERALTALAPPPDLPPPLDRLHVPDVPDIPDVTTRPNGRT